MEEEQSEPKKSRLFTRFVGAHILMTIFVASTSAGAFLVFPPAGFLVLGATSGLYGFLLGAN